MYIMNVPELKSVLKINVRVSNPPCSPLLFGSMSFTGMEGRKIRSVTTSKGNKRLDARDKWRVSDMLGLFFSASSLLLLEDSKNNSYFTGWRSERIPTVNTQLVH